MTESIPVERTFGGISVNGKFFFLLLEAVPRHCETQRGGGGVELRGEADEGAQLSNLNAVTQQRNSSSGL